MSSSFRAKQHGAALLLGIALLALIALAWRERASLSQLFMAQQTLNQATAAAVLTAAQFHARRLNAHAFLNRTMVAHRVAMAHLITIASAEKMRIEMSRQATRNNPPVFLIGLIIGQQHAAAYAAAKFGPVGQTQQAIEELHRAFQAHDQVLHVKLAQARQALVDQSESEVKSLVREVLERNLGKSVGAYVDLQVQVTNPLGPLALVVKDPTSERWRDWFDQVVSQHPYLKSRRKTATNLFWVHPKCPLMFPQLRRRGYSELLIDGIWQATDTLSFHKVRGIITKLCYWREYPMGWANITSRAIDNEANQQTKLDQWLSAVGQAPATFGATNFLRWVTSKHVIGHVLTGFSNLIGDNWGLNSQIRWRSRQSARPYVLSGSADQATIVSVKQPIASLNSPLLHLGLRVSVMLKAGSHWGRHLSSQAAAKAYFDRLDARADGRGEFDNLFQPFWLARQVPVVSAVPVVP